MKGTDSKSSRCLSLWNDTLSNFFEFGKYDCSVWSGQATTVPLSYLRFDSPVCENGNDISGIGTQYHVPNAVKVNELSRGVIECYSPHFAHSLLFQSSRVHSSVCVVLRIPRNSPKYSSGPSSLDMSPKLSTRQCRRLPTLLCVDGGIGIAVDGSLF